MKVILFESNNTVVICHLNPAHCDDITKEAVDVVPAGEPYWVVDDMDLPLKDGVDFRLAWAIDKSVPPFGYSRGVQ